MVGGQRVLDLEPFGGLTIPRRRGEAIEAGTVAGWGRADRCQEVEGPARPIQARMARTLGPFSAPLLGEGARASRPRMVQRSGRQYHDSRTPFVEGAEFPSAILRRG